MTPSPGLRFRNRSWIFALAMVVLIRVGFSQEMVFRYSFPTEDMIGKDIFIKQGAAIECDGQGNIYVVDLRQSIILKFGPKGKFLQRIGRPGQGPGDLMGPRGIQILDNGDMIVYDAGNRRIVTLSADGTYKNSFKVFRPYTDFCIANGKIYLACYELRDDHKTVDVYSVEGVFQGSIGEQLDFGTVDRLSMRSINDKMVCCASTGELLVGWNFFPIVQIYDRDGRGKLKQIEIVSPKNKERYEHNLHEIRNPDRNSEPQFWLVSHKMKAHGAGFYLMIPEARIELLNCGLDGSVKSVFWAPLPVPDGKYIGEDFVLRRNGKVTWIYILQRFPESTVNVYSVGN